MGEQGPSSTTSSRIGRIVGSPKSWGIVGALVAIALTWVVVMRIKPHTAYPAHPRIVPDPSVVIGTFVTLYGLFIGGFGVLITFVAKKSNKKKRLLEALKAAAIVLLAAAALFDVWRVWDASNDLYKAATHGFSYPALRDDVKDFRIYLILNLIVVIFGIFVAALLPSSAESSQDRSTTRGDGRIEPETPWPPETWV